MTISVALTMSLLGMVMLPSGQVVPNPYCGLQFTLTLHNIIDVNTFIWHTTMCLIMTLLCYSLLCLPPLSFLLVQLKGTGLGRCLHGSWVVEVKALEGEACVST